MLADERQVAAGQGAGGVHRRHLVDGDQRCLVVGAHQVAGIHTDLAGAAGEGRADGGKAQFQAGRVHRRLAGLDRGAEGGHPGGGLVGLFRGHEPLGRGRGVAGQFAPAVLQFGPVPGQLGLGPGQDRGKGPRVDGEEQRARLDLLSLGEVDLFERAGHPAAHRHRGRGLDVGSGGQFHRHGGGAAPGNGHRYGRALALFGPVISVARAAGEGEGQQAGEQQGEQAAPEKPPARRVGDRAGADHGRWRFRLAAGRGGVRRPRSASRRPGPCTGRPGPGPGAGRFRPAGPGPGTGSPRSAGR